MRNRLGKVFGPRVVDKRRRRRSEPLSPDVGGQHLASLAKDTDLVLHIGLHKTASSYVQGVLAASRKDLRREGVLYPTTGIVDKGATSTREGAGSGHGLLSRRGRHRTLLARLMAELEGVPTALISSEEFSRGGDTPSPEKLLDRFKVFKSIRVVLVLRRQDEWIESFYKQSVDQYGNFETRSFDEFVERTGPRLFDFHTRFTPWRDLVGAENFHVLSYDDLPDGTAICRRLLEIAGVRGPILDQLGSVAVPRYDSVRAIDTVGLRILNSHRLEDRDIRTRIAKSIYDVAPTGDIELMSAGTRGEIQAMCRPINQRIADEWFAEPVPGFLFGKEPRASATSPPSGLEMVDYVDQVIALCEDGLRAARPETMWVGEGE